MRIVFAEAGSGSWLGIDWLSLLLVLVVALVATVVVVGSFSLATRLMAVGAPDIEVPAGEEPDGPSAVVRPRVAPRPAAATLAAGACYAVGVAATLYGIYLVIPLFHAGG
jgi:hypothetical protein